MTLSHSIGFPMNADSRPIPGPVAGVSCRDESVTLHAGAGKPCLSRTNALLSMGEGLSHGRRYLAGLGLEEANLEAEVLLRHLLGLSRAYLYSHLDECTSQEQYAAYQALLGRRATREPLAYITGVREFYGLDIYVDRSVLVPRPETEMLVDESLRFIGGGRKPLPVLADIGAGSGAIAVALAKGLPEAHLFAIDSSAQALRVSSLNCVRHGVAGRVTLLQGDLLEPLSEPVDLIVANLPYVPSAVIDTLAPEVSGYEPRLALDGGPDGLHLIRRLLAQAPGALRPSGSIILELGADQGPAAARVASGVFPRASVRLVPDLAGLDRMLVVELAG